MSLAATLSSFRRCSNGCLREFENIPELNDEDREALRREGNVEKQISVLE